MKSSVKFINKALALRGLPSYNPRHRRAPPKVVRCAMPRGRGAWTSVVNLLVTEADELNCQLLVNAFRSKRFGILVTEATATPENAVTVIKEQRADVTV